MTSSTLSGLPVGNNSDICCVAAVPPYILSGQANRFQEEFSQLREEYKVIHGPDEYPVQLSPGLRLKESLEQELETVELERPAVEQEIWVRASSILVLVMMTEVMSLPEKEVHIHD